MYIWKLILLPPPALRNVCKPVCTRAWVDARRQERTENVGAGHDRATATQMRRLHGVLVKGSLVVSGVRSAWRTDAYTGHCLHSIPLHVADIDTGATCIISITRCDTKTFLAYRYTQGSSRLFAPPATSDGQHAICWHRPPLRTLNEHNLESRVGIGKTSSDDAAGGTSSVGVAKTSSGHPVRRRTRKGQRHTLQRSRRLPLGGPC